MKKKIRELLAKFGDWLWNRYRTVTATELMILKEAERPIPCEHCGLSPVHFIDRSCCKHIIGNQGRRGRYDNKL